MSLQTFLFMTSSQADTVRGLTVNGHALAPVMTIIPGITSFVLPIACKDDLSHVLRSSQMNSFSQQTLETSAIFPFPTSSLSTAAVTYPSSELVIVDNCTYKSSWPVGQLVHVST